MNPTVSPHRQGGAEPGRAFGHRVVTAVTTRLLVAFAKGPAGRAHPARDTAGRYG